jgi:hypothetical protein
MTRRLLPACRQEPLSGRPILSRCQLPASTVMHAEHLRHVGELAIVPCSKTSSSFLFADHKLTPS